MERRHPSEDDRSDDELFAVALDQVWLDHDADEATDPRRTLRWRGTREIFDRAAAMTRSADPRERCVGVDVAAGMRDLATWVADMPAGDPRWADYGYPEEVAELVVPMADPSEHPEVLRSIAWAFDRCGGFGQQYAALVPLIAHPDEEVRYAVTHALSACQWFAEDDMPAGERAAVEAHNEPIAAALAVLAGDEDGDVRDWALFGLAALGLDRPDLRQLYVDHLGDAHEGAREEAIYALAALGDERAVEPVIGLLEDVDEDSVPGHGAIEAAAALADPRLLPALERLVGDEDVHQPWLQAAIAACS